MAFSELERQLIKRVVGAYCTRKSLAQYRDELEVLYHIDGQAVTIVEKRPAFQLPGEFTETFVARLRYTRTNGLWTLYWADRNSEWHIYELAEPSRDLKQLLTEVDRDQTRIFWG